MAEAYVTRADLKIAMWFWPASLDSKSLPVEVVAPLNNAPTTLNYEDAINAWGKPQAFFGSDFGNGSDCSMSENFNNHEIIFDTTYVPREIRANTGCADTVCILP